MTTNDIQIDVCELHVAQLSVHYRYRHFDSNYNTPFTTLLDNITVLDKVGYQRTV
jgi:hypothetical protein